MRDDPFRLVGLLIAIIAVVVTFIVGVFVPEVRVLFGLPPVGGLPTNPNVSQGPANPPTTVTFTSTAAEPKRDVVMKSSTLTPDTPASPCESYLPRGGLMSPPSYGDVVGGDARVLDGQIIDVDLNQPGNRRIAVRVELPRGLGTVTVGVDSATHVLVVAGCRKGNRDDLQCGRFVRILRTGGNAEEIDIIREDEIGQRLQSCPD